MGAGMWLSSSEPEKHEIAHQMCLLASVLFSGAPWWHCRDVPVALDTGSAPGSLLLQAPAFQPWVCRRHGLPCREQRILWARRHHAGRPGRDLRCALVCWGLVGWGGGGGAAAGFGQQGSEHPDLVRFGLNCSLSAAEGLWVNPIAPSFPPAMPERPFLPPSFLPQQRWLVEAFDLRGL